MENKMRRRILAAPLATLCFVSYSGRETVFGETAVRRVTFAANSAQPFDALMAVALEANIPMGVEFAGNDNTLCKHPVSVSIRDAEPLDAVMIAKSPLA
jgi:hypothetical protein